MKRRAGEALSVGAIKAFLQRHEGGEAFDQLLADWKNSTGLASETLKDLLRGIYATANAALAYRELRYKPRTLHFAPRNFRARLLCPQLISIRRRARAGADPSDLANEFHVGRRTIDEVVKGSYSSLAMRDALAIDPPPQQ